MVSLLCFALVCAQDVDDQVETLLQAFELQQEFQERALLQLAAQLSGLGTTAADPIARRLQEDLEDGDPSPEAPALLRALSGRNEEEMIIEGLRFQARAAGPGERRRLMTLLGEAGTPGALMLLEELALPEPRTPPEARPIRITEEPRVTIGKYLPVESDDPALETNQKVADNPDSDTEEGSIAYNVVLGTLGVGIVLLLLSFMRKGFGK